MIQDAARSAPDVVKRVRCAVYTRKSTEKGLEKDFNSLDAQREACEAYVRSQAAAGWILVADQYSDGGYSGATTERPAFERLLRDVEAGRIDCLLVHRYDRLSRSLIDFLNLVATLDSRGVAFASVTQPFNTTTSAGRLMLHMLLSVAQFEREMIQERTRDKISAAKRHGKWCGGHPPTGFDVDAKGGCLVVNSEEAERVRAIFDLYIEKQSLLAVVAEVSRRGWMTKSWASRKGREWRGGPYNKVTLSRLLSSRVVIGEIEYKGEVFKGEHEAIVPREKWDRVQAMLAKHARAGGSEVRNKHASLLKGVLRCGPCGAAMTPTYAVKGPKKYRYYACVKAQKEGAAVCPTRIVAAGEIERAVIDRIRAIGQDAGLVAAVIAEARARLKGEIGTLTTEGEQRAAEVRDVNAEIRRLVGDTAKGSGAPIADQLAELQERLRDAEGALAEAGRKLEAARATRVEEADLAAALSSFDQVWDALFPRERERIVKLLLESIEIGAGAEEMRLNFRPSGIRTLAAEMQTEEAIANGSDAPETAARR